MEGTTPQVVRNLDTQSLRAQIMGTSNAVYQRNQVLTMTADNMIVLLPTFEPIKNEISIWGNLLNAAAMPQLYIITANDDELFKAAVTYYSNSEQKIKYLIGAGRCESAFIALRALLAHTEEVLGHSADWGS
nr:hypothetical protein B0A51_08198 [Rachicladosporium sp. CCFEE 5018]